MKPLLIFYYICYWFNCYRVSSIVSILELALVMELTGDYY